MFAASKLLSSTSTTHIRKRLCIGKFALLSTKAVPSDYLRGSTTHFGFEEVAINEKESKVRGVFSNVADNYDVMNDFMSGGLHRLWKDELLNMTGVAAVAPALRASSGSTLSSDTSTQNLEAGALLNILDVAGGTGDIAFRFLEAASCPERSKSSGLDEIAITVCDINPDMLRVGESRARERYGNSILDDTKSIKFQEGSAQDLPFDDNTFDIYTISFGLRNVTDVDLALREANRVLKPGGRFLCLEFSHVTNPVLATMYDQFSFNVIPALGEAVANDRPSYQYLVESIRKFCTQEELKARLEKNGFVGCKFTNMTQGIVAVHEGWKNYE